MRISDWSSDVCSSDLSNFGLKRTIGPFSTEISEVDVGRIVRPLDHLEIAEKHGWKCIFVEALGCAGNRQLSSGSSNGDISKATFFLEITIGERLVGGQNALLPSGQSSEERRVGKEGGS